MSGRTDLTVRFLTAIVPLIFIGAGIQQSNHSYAVRDVISRARLFGEGIFSVPEWHDGAGIFTSDGRRLYFTRADEKFTRSRVYYSDFADGEWSAPQLAPFSNSDYDAGCRFTPDGRVLFTSQRPTLNKEISDAWNIWMAKRSKGEWTTPQIMPAPINSNKSDCCAVVVGNNVIYFSSDRDGSWDIYRAAANRKGEFEITKLDSSVNSSGGEWPSFVDSRERFMLFSSIRPGGLGGDDVYISYRRNGRWSQAENLGAMVNTDAFEDSAVISPDGRYFFWSSMRSIGGGKANSNIYQIDLSALGLKIER